MTICLLNTIKETDERVRVGVIHYKPKRLNTEQRSAGIMLNGLTEADIPEPEIQRGKNPVLYANPKTQEMWYEYVDRPFTQEEIMEELTAKIDALITKQDELVTLLKDSKTG